MAPLRFGRREMASGTRWCAGSPGFHMAPRGRCQGLAPVVNVGLHRTRRSGRLLAAPAALFTLGGAVWSSYLGAVTLAALFGRSRSRRASSTAASHFEVFVPAHDEEAVIEETVRSLVVQQYPDDRFAVHVVADNCTDDTADRARAAGACVHVRDDPSDAGKGAALNWLAGEVQPEPASFVVVIDADTIAAPDFLLAMDGALSSGARVAQGYYGVRDPETSPAVAIRFAALACRHHVRPLGRTRLGGSCGLYGNGMAFDARIVEQHPWSGHLIEDAEFQLELVLEGVPVAYAPAARVAAEMPDRLDASVTQHQRWERGRWLTVRRFAGPLLGRVVRGGPLPRRVYLDAFLDLLVPPLSMLVMVNVVAVLLGLGARIVHPGRPRWLPVAVASAMLTAFHVVAGLVLVRAPASVWRSLLAAPRLIGWKLALLVGVARRPDDVTWSRTARNATGADGSDS